MDFVTVYSTNLAAAARRRRSARAGGQEAVLRGQLRGLPRAQVRHQPQCQAGRAPFQLIWPYTDMLVHDMGDDLADGVSDGLANGREWRTPPLWGIGLTKTVNPGATWLHDGRARTLLEAVLWHGGAAAGARPRGGDDARRARRPDPLPGVPVMPPFTAGRRAGSVPSRPLLASLTGRRSGRCLGHCPDPSRGPCAPPRSARWRRSRSRPGCPPTWASAWRATTPDPRWPGWRRPPNRWTPRWAPGARARRAPLHRRDYSPRLATALLMLCVRSASEMQLSSKKASEAWTNSERTLRTSLSSITNSGLPAAFGAASRLPAARRYFAPRCFHAREPQPKRPLLGDHTKERAHLGISNSSRGSLS